MCRNTADMKVGDSIEIDTGSGVETRKIANIATAAANPTAAVASRCRMAHGDHDPRRLDQRAGFQRGRLSPSARKLAWDMACCTPGGRRQHN